MRNDGYLCQYKSKSVIYGRIDWNIVEEIIDEIHECQWRITERGVQRCVRQQESFSQKYLEMRYIVLKCSVLPILRLLISLYNPARVYEVFRFLLTIFLILRRQPALLGMRPLSPEGLLSTIQRLGTSFIKLAQVLATRADFFEAEYISKLRELHDSLPQMRSADFDKVFVDAFGDGAIFESFERSAFASASIGQVHIARLAKTGEKVAVKLRRHRIDLVVRQDIRILSFFLRLFRPLFSDDTRNSVESVLEAFSSMILKEVDMAVELTNIEKFRDIYGNSTVQFPRPYPQYSSRLALVMSFEEGVRFDDHAALHKLKVSFPELMEKLVLLYTEQMLIKGYFHADPHPGNLLVNSQGELILVDFGMVTRISNETRLAMISIAKAAYERDYGMLVSSAKKLGIITNAARGEDLEELCEQIFNIFDNEALSASSMQQLVFDLLQSMRHMPFKLPQEIIYVMRVSAIIEGLGTTYIPNFNGVKDILPILRANLPRALGAGGNIFKGFVNELKQLPHVVPTLRKILDETHEEGLRIQLSRYENDRWRAEIEKLHRRSLAVMMLLASAFYVRGLPISYSLEISVVLFILAILRLVFFW